MLFTGQGLVRMVKNRDLSLEILPLAYIWPRAVFSRHLSQFFTIRTSQLANNICLFPEIEYQISFYLEDKLVYYHYGGFI